MVRIAFSDESGTHSGNKCYGIGAFVVQASEVNDLEANLRLIFQSHGIDYEVKWNRLSSYRPDVEAACEGIHSLLTSGASFNAIVVEKSTFQKWQQNREEAFYMSYQYLATHVARASSEPFECWIDSRSDSYEKRPEVMRIITNYRARREPGTAELEDVRMVDSRKNPIVQMADVLIGAITADTNRYLTTKSDLGEGKDRVIKRLAAMIGWDRLWYDTFPNPEFDVWHFPIQFRGRPGTRQVVLAPEVTRWDFPTEASRLA